MMGSKPYEQRTDFEMRQLESPVRFGDYENGNYTKFNTDGSQEIYVNSVSMGEVTSSRSNEYSNVGDLFQTTFNMCSEGQNNPIQSTTIKIIGDSTSQYEFPGTGLTKNWIYKIAEEFASSNTSVRVKFWELDASYKWGLEGEINNTGENRHIVLQDNGGLLPQMEYSSIQSRSSSDLDIAVKVYFDDWTPAGSFGTTTLICLGDNYSDIAWRVNVLSDNRIQLEYTTDGSTIQNYIVAPTPYTDGTWKWIRVTVDVDNGAAGHDIEIFDGDPDEEFDQVTWNSLGSTTRAGAITLYDDVDNILLGSYDIVRDPDFAFKVESVVLRDGIDGPNIMPVNIESFRALDYFQSSFYQGQPTIHIMNGAYGGNAASDFLTSDRYKKAVTSDIYAPVIINLGHNEGAATGTKFQKDMESLYNLIVAMGNTGDVIFLTQNPKWSDPLGATDTRQSRFRMYDIMLLVKHLNCKFINTYQMIEDYCEDKGVTIDTLIPDGTHYNQSCVDEILYPRIRKLFLR